MTHADRSDPTRRDVLKTCSQGLIAAGLAAPLAGTVMAAPQPQGQPNAANPSPDGPRGQEDAVRASASQSGGGQPKAEATWSTPTAPPDKQPPNLKIPDAPQRKAGWAIVGLGQLALEEVLPAFRVCERSRPVALVSGHPDKARKVAAAYDVPEKAIYSYDNYEQMRDNPDIDVVYIILPNTMHSEYTIRAHRIGKHVLCEKPMATSPAECEAMIAAARQAGRKLMVAYRLRYEPYNQAMIEMARKKVFGPIQLIEASNVQDIKPPNIRLSKALGGGALYDIGIYCLNACRYVTGEEPTHVSGWVHSDPADPRFREVDQSVAFQLRFPSGAMATCQASHGAGEGRRYRVYCSDGWMELDPAFSYRGLRMRTARKQGQDTQEIQEVRLREVNHFASEMDHFSECVLEGKSPRTPGEEGLRDLRVMTKIFEAARTGGTVAV